MFWQAMHKIDECVRSAVECHLDQDSTRLVSVHFLCVSFVTIFQCSLMA